MLIPYVVEALNPQLMEGTIEMVIELMEMSIV